jgi:hypothetical protein
MTATRVCAGWLLFVCLASAQFGWFHDRRIQKNHTGEDSVAGVVVKTSADTFVIRAADTRVITFKIADSTLFFHGSKWTRPSLLKRGALVSVEATGDAEGNLTADEVVFQDTLPPLSVREPASAMLPGGVKDDPLVQQSREASEAFVNMLPNFLCQQSTTRSYSESDRPWRTLDRVTAEVLYDHGHESYRDVKLNGRSTGHSMMDLPGSRSAGEFGSTLRALFDRDTDALFKFQANTQLAGFATAIYEFAVSGDTSDWRISAGSQMIMTPYAGKIWIDRKSGNVVRIEMKAVDIPKLFPFRSVAAEVDYGPVMLPSGRYFLPQKAENVSCDDLKSCSKNVIEFRNYHKYVGESSNTFENP